MFLFLLSDPQTPYWGLKDAVYFQFNIFREYVLAPSRGFGGHNQNISFNIIYYLINLLM